MITFLQAALSQLFKKVFVIQSSLSHFKKQNALIGALTTIKIHTDPEYN